MIHILLTGGTIEGVDYAVKDNETNNGSVSTRNFLEIENVSFPYAIQKVFKKTAVSIRKTTAKI